MAMKTQAGTWRVRWRVLGKFRSRTFRRKIDADHFETNLKYERTVGQWSPLAKLRGQTTTFTQYAQEWLRLHGAVHKIEASLIRDRQILRDYLQPAFGEKRLVEITRTDLVRLQSDLSGLGRLKPKTINNIMGLAHSILLEAVKMGDLVVNPAGGLRQIKVPEQPYRFWSMDERDRFLTFARNRDWELYRVIAFAVHTGLRKGEVQALTRGDLDFTRRRIMVHRNYCDKTKKINEFTKGKRPRVVPMNEMVVEILREVQMREPEALVFGTKMHHLVERRFKPMQRLAQVNAITFHDLRHTFASHLAMMGTSVFHIQKVLGHSELHTTMRYMHLAPDQLDGLTDTLLTGRAGEHANERRRWVG
ncbi:MAG: hypothetical protein A2284_05985 [Deltaproteobacteria bacterium RIFOXYA12_FULL_61_11]|nr:MAG: hypothetical protein A2284_05985 [Deltaproteobacteria bacterium RIFOXYA12_FULL_61_11]